MEGLILKLKEIKSKLVGVGVGERGKKEYESRP